MLNLKIIGLNHKTAPVQIREKLSLNDSLTNYHKQIGEPESFTILNTCNRTEIILLVDNDNQQEKIKQFILEKIQINNDDYEKYFYHYADNQALEHLFQVASGIDSLIIGESQILGQLKTAFELAINENFAQIEFFSLYQQILQCAKRVQRETSINQGSLSIPYIATQLAQNIFENISQKTALLIGAGEICQLTGVHLKEIGIKYLSIINRSRENAEKLAQELSAQVYPFEQLKKAIAETDIIISSTSSLTVIITKEMVEEIMASRPSSPLFLIDIAVPRDIAAKVNTIDNVFLYNIDDLKKIVESNHYQKKSQIQDVQNIINEEINRFHAKIETNKLAPIIKKLQWRLEEVKNNELNKLINRNNFDEKITEQIAYSMQTIINKILHDPLITLRQNVTKKESKSFLKIFKEIFNL